jgi:GNAT superfamily N-acetyltransferase
VSAPAKPVAIRPFRAPDAAYCHGLRRRAFLEVFGGLLDPGAIKAGADAYDREEFGNLIGALDSFVAMDGRKRVGFCTIRYPEKSIAEILYVYVDLACLGKGIGTQLVRYAEWWIAERHPDVSSIVLDTAVPDYNGKFYEKLGYSRLGPTLCRYPAGEVAALRLRKTVSR